MVQRTVAQHDFFVLFRSLSRGLLCHVISGSLKNMGLIIFAWRCMQCNAMQYRQSSQPSL